MEWSKSIGNYEACPASWIQRQFWVLYNFYPHSSVYNIPLVSVIKGKLNPEALEIALNTLLNKYRNFRPIFEVDDSGELIQRFLPWQKRLLPEVDLSTQGIKDADDVSFNKILNEEIQQPFDLTSGPLLRFKLFNIEENVYVLAITVHHIIFDLSTKELFASELSKAYSAALRDKSATESIETAEYSDFCEWEKSWVNSDESKKMELSWKHYLEGSKPSLKLPFDFIDKDRSSLSGTIEPIRMTHDMFQLIKVFCRKEAVAPFLVLLTAWSLALARLTGQNKITIGVPLTNRRKNEFKKTMGCFVNILPMVLDLSGNPTMNETLRLIRRAMLKMHRMQEMPYYKLVQLMREKGMIGSNALFQAGFTFEPPIQLELEGVSVKPEYIHHGGAQLDLFAIFWQEGDEIKGLIEYDSARFSPVTIENLAEDMLSIVDELCAMSPQDSDTGTEKEQDQLLAEWNDTKIDYPSDLCVHELYESQARLTPNAVAVEFEGEQLTYVELDNLSGKFAKSLRSLGVGPNSLVALYIDRSLEMVIALLGILKAGGAYLPLDMIFPRERLESIIEDAKPQILVTMKKRLDDLPSNQAKVVCVDDFPDLGETPSYCDLPKPDNLAYVLYTSGSTGKPKGVEISHRSLINFLTSMRLKPGINAEDTLLSVTTISFDIFGLELWLPLITGAKVVIVKQEVTMDGKQLAKVIESNNVTIMQATPATWQILLESGWEGKSHLKILCGGEAWSQELARQLLSRCASLWNMYGPTETTIWSAICQIKDSDPVLIGWPIANTQFYVVDSKLQLVPVGTPGELLIGGLGLSPGYLNRPELTAEKFILDSFGTDSKSRLYRTGDLVRYMPDGKLEFIGRMDHQVKIRGFRIELGEIEKELTSKVGVQQAVVKVHEENGEKLLIAYIVMQEDSNEIADGLRSFLKQKLPGYMIPSSFIFLDKMPLTANGKINRKALPSPDKIKHKVINEGTHGKVDPKILEWNKTDRAYPLDKCLQSFIEEQVVKTPDLPALTYEDKTISYDTLNKQINRLAHFLKSKGIGPDTMVGVCAFRSMERVIALHAIIKAGGAYVPLDPTYPANRLAFMLEDSCVPIILAQKACGNLLKDINANVIYFEDIIHELESCPTDNPPIITKPENLAYVIYTSGSTGKPKGVMNTHRGIVNRLLWMQETFQISGSDTLVQKTPFSFDVSVWEFFWPFMFGARLVVARPEGHKDTDYLLNLIKKEKITVIHFVPSMLRMFLEKADQESCTSLGNVVLSGEVLSIDLQKRYFTVLKAPLHNLYGPTEAAVDVSYWKCKSLSESKVVPIGRPISNTKLYILDESLQHVSIGESGELHIGGVQVARGYLNLPELTAEKFISDPFSDDQSARLYKTGDLCRFLPDGNIEYLGRIDFQVKIRGNRVELGEIETTIINDPSVKDCVVLALEEIPGEQRLIAYIIENDRKFSFSAMRQKLAAELPGYMIPAAFITIPSFPLTPSGKIDRLALPMPDHKRPDLANKYVATRTESEGLIARTWKGLLPVDTVGLDDNFFDLGGHSLLLVRLATMLGNIFHKDISVMSLFEHPTVRQQADFIRGITGEVNSKEIKISAQHQINIDENDWEDGEI